MRCVVPFGVRVEGAEPQNLILGVDHPQRRQARYTDVPALVLQPIDIPFSGEIPVMVHISHTACALDEMLHMFDVECTADDAAANAAMAQHANQMYIPRSAHARRGQTASPTGAH